MSRPVNMGVGTATAHQASRVAGSSNRRVSVGVALLALVLALATAMSGCATPSTRIATALTRYGLDDGQARCVGDDLQRSLSLGQLRQLDRAARAYRTGDSDPARLTPSDLVRAGGELPDARIVAVVARAGLRCGIAP